jgi:hypothetical protein
MVQVVQTAELATALGQYIDPDQSYYGEEIAAYAERLAPVLAAAGVQQVLFWDDQDGGDPTLDMELWEQEEVIPLTYNSSGGSYYGLTSYKPKYMSNGPDPLVWHLWFGGSPLNSAPGFYVVAAGVSFH